MPELTNVAVDAAPIDRYRALLEDQVWAEFNQVLRDESTATAGRVVWNVNSTALGGGVAELLAALLPYEKGAGMDVRWVVIDAAPPFFEFTKRLHTLLHGVSPDGTGISPADRTVYESTLAENAEILLQTIRPRDIVILHDPQTAGLAPALTRHGCHVIWRCHIGVDEPTDTVRSGWQFLQRYVNSAQVAVFSRRAHVWDWLEPNRVEIIPPSIDAFTPKNQDMDQPYVTAILRAVGLIDGAAIGPLASFVRHDGSTGHVSRRAVVVENVRVPEGDCIVVQVSRWDRLKDPIGVLDGFVGNVDDRLGAHLVLAGPAITSVVDDPEQPAVMRELQERWERLERSTRARVHLAQLPTDDADENAAIVNALQRRADVVVQKSIAEGFGLTVAEAMWKGRALVASRVGGIADQIEHGKSGVLIDDPQDLATFGQAVAGLLSDADDRRRLGEEAHRRVAHQFLSPRQLIQQAKLVCKVIQS